MNLLVGGEALFPDQRIYIHSPGVRMARLANYNNFSKAMVGEKGKSALSAEYFTFQDEDLWRMPDADLKRLAVEELAFMGLIDKRAAEQAWVIRETESYPTYYLGFQKPYGVLQKAAAGFQNLRPIGRGGLYKYNNQDHSTLSGILAARNHLKAPGSPYDIWDINTDSEYLESGSRPREALDGSSATRVFRAESKRGWPDREDAHVAGRIAQLARALGLHPRGYRFKSCFAHQTF